MTIDPVTDPGSPPIFRGVLGGGCLRPGLWNLRLIRKAIKEGWLEGDSPDLIARRQALVDHLCGVLGKGKTRHRLSAARCLFEATEANTRILSRLLREVEVTAEATEPARPGREARQAR